MNTFIVSSVAILAFLGYAIYKIVQSLNSMNTYLDSVPKPLEYSNDNSRYKL